MTQFFFVIAQDGVRIQVRLVQVEDINPADRFVSVTAESSHGAFCQVVRQLTDSGEVHAHDPWDYLSKSVATMVNMRLVHQIMQPIVERLDKDNTPISFPSELKGVHRPLISKIVGRNLRFARNKVCIDKDVDRPTYIHPSVIKYAYDRLRYVVEAAVKSEYGCGIEVSRVVAERHNANKVYKRLLGAKKYDEVVKAGVEEAITFNRSLEMTSVQIVVFKKTLKTMLSC